MQRASKWVVAQVVLAAVMAAAIVGSSGPRAVADDPSPEAAEERTFAAVRSLLSALTTTKSGPVPGMPKAKALATVKAWSAIATDWMTPLEASPYALGAEWKGVVRVFIGDEIADDLAVYLLVPGTKRSTLRAFVAEELAGLRYEVDDDPQNAWTCFGTAKGRRDVWVGIGEGILSVEVSVP